MAEPTEHETKVQAVRIAAERDLDTFIRLVAPEQVLGGMHSDLFQFWFKEGARSHQLALLPRDHGKSRMVAFRVAWEITRNPIVTVLYISATSMLAIKQVQFIKDIITSPIYRYYWPEVVAENEGDRKKWSSTEIVVDHPKRAGTLLKDPTIMAAGLTTNLIGHHFDVCVLDDVVVSGNAWTQEGRNKVSTQISYLASILGAEGRVWAVGTRYHLEDYYAHMKEITYDTYTKDGDLAGEEPLYEIHERVVEESGIGLGPFLWPRTTSPNGNQYGFDRNILARKRAQYNSVIDYRSQYYNDVRDTQGGVATRDMFSYFDPSNLSRHSGYLYHGKDKLSLVAAVDFAYTLNTRSDFTCIVVVGVNADHQYFILDIDRFKTDRISAYYEHIRDLNLKWDVRKWRMETTAAQSIIVKDLKENWFKLNGISISIDEFRPSIREGSKAERILNTLEPKYHERRIFHYVGGNNDLLEAELLDGNSPHDDCKDALAAAVDFAKPPSRNNPFARLSEGLDSDVVDGIQANPYSRFGGISRTYG